MPSMEDEYAVWDEEKSKLIREIKGRYEPMLYAKDMEILSLKMTNEALRKELDAIWKMGIEKLVEQKLKVRDLEERWGKLLGDK